MPIDKLDVGDEGKVAERDSEINLRELGKKERLATVLNSYEGREFAWNIVKWCNTFSVAPLGAEEMNRFEGKRDVGLFIWGKCFTSRPDVYNLAEREALRRDSEEKNV